jgi:hypothetical protein
MLALLTLLAQTSGGISPQDVGIIIAAVLGALGIGAVGGNKIANAKRVSVSMEEQFVSRREFDAINAQNSTAITRLEGIILRGADRVEEKHLELLATIERAAKTGTDGRVALWNELNAQGKRLAATEAHVDVAARLERITTELLKKPSRG